MRVSRFLLLAGLLALLTSGACAPGGGPPDAAPAPADMAAPPTPPPMDEARLILLRSARWPGGGRELTLGVLNDRTGRPFADDLSARINVRASGSLTVAAAPRVPALGYTAVLLPPRRTAEERAALAAALQAFAAARPGDRVALYRHGAQVQLFSGFLLNQTALGEALQRYQQGTDDESSLPPDQALATVIAELRAVGGAGPDVLRSLVVLSPEPGQVDVRSREVYAVAVTPDAAGLTEAAAALDEVRSRAFYRVSVCGKPEKFAAALQVAELRGDLKATFSATLPEDVGAPCDVSKMSSETRSFTPRIEFVFDDAQRAAYAERVRATQRATFDEALARSDFTLRVRLAPDQQVLVEATAHLRGNSSLGCERKNYTLKLAGPDRSLMPDSATDEFHLISMCDDAAYTYAPTAYALFGEDLFPLRRRFVELVVDGQQRGIYLLTEKAREALVAGHARVETVMRRGYPVMGRDFFEVDYASDGDLMAPLARYAQFMDLLAPLAEDALVAALRERMDLDQYLRWLANQSVLQSGDYVDEAYFLATQQADGKGQVGQSYRVMPWDAEGYTACHAGGTMAYVDPYQLAYCAEGRLDHKILADPKVYQLFATRLEDALAGALAPDKMTAALGRTRDALQARLVDPPVCAAMIELQRINPGAADCAVARDVVAARAAALLTAYNNRRALLLARLDAYRKR